MSIEHQIGGKDIPLFGFIGIIKGCWQILAANLPRCIECLDGLILCYLVLRFHVLTLLDSYRRVNGLILRCLPQSLALPLHD